MATGKHDLCPQPTLSWYSRLPVRSSCNSFHSFSWHLKAIEATESMRVVYPSNRSKLYSKLEK